MLGFCWRRFIPKENGPAARAWIGTNLVQTIENALRPTALRRMALSCDSGVHDFLLGRVGPRLAFLQILAPIIHGLQLLIPARVDGLPAAVSEVKGKELEAVAAF